MTPYIADSDFTLYVGDVREVLAELPAASIDCCVTSPPYWGLRDYGAEGQIGLEASPEEYVEKLVAVFREVRRVLADTGTVWLNLGDSYNNRNMSRASSHQTGLGFDSPDLRKSWVELKAEGRTRMSIENGDLKEKDLCGVPWMVAFALRADGWYLRSEIIWAKPNTMPESVTDRPTKAHEYVFMLTKQPRYFFDQEAVREPHSPDGRLKTVHDHDTSMSHPNYDNIGKGNERWPNGGRNIRSVWEIPTASYSEAHFATFPEKLPELCIKAGCPEQVCAMCGKPRKRVVERRPSGFDGSKYGERAVAATGGAIAGGTAASTLGSGGGKLTADYETVGWSDCGCAYGLEPDALEIIETPTGVRAGDDPSLLTGRAGMNRPRGDNEGRRPITRYEQRRYAEQLKASPAKERMEAEAGPAFAHYIRTDTSGARPVPDELLERWIADGLIERVELPPRSGTNYRPGVVLDPFMGSGTTALVARRLGRHTVGVELNPEYAKICAGRLQQLSLLA